MLLAHASVDVNRPHSERITKGYGVDYTPKTALQYASAIDALEVMGLLLTIPNIDANVLSGTGCTALHYACMYNHRFAVRRLVAHPSVDVNVPTPIGRFTPLHVAVSNNRYNAVCALLAPASTRVNNDANAARSNTTSSHIFDANPAISRVFDANVANFHINDAKGNDASSRINGVSGNDAGVGAISRSGAVNVNAVDVRGQTALHLAAISGFVEIAEKLALHPFVNPNVADNDGDTPLHLSSRHNRPSVTKVLLGMPGIDLEAQNHLGLLWYEHMYVE